MEKFNIPEKTVVNSTLYKNHFYEEGKLNKSEMKIFADNIEKITLLFSLTEDNMNIKPYRDDNMEYEEIAIIQVAIDNKLKSNKIGDIIQRTIPYPTLVLFTLDDEIQMNLSCKRINKADKSKNLIEKTIRTHWINRNKLTQIEKDFFESLSMENLSFANFYKLYMDIFHRAIMLNTADFTKDYKVLLTKDIEKIKRIKNQIDITQLTIDESKKKIKKEDNFNRGLELNMRIKVFEEKIQQLVDEILV